MSILRENFVAFVIVVVYIWGKLFLYHGFDSLVGLLLFFTFLVNNSVCFQTSVAVAIFLFFGIGMQDVLVISRRILKFIIPLFSRIIPARL